MADLQGKVVVIAGGSAGVGRATAEAFAQEGAKVAGLAALALAFAVGGTLALRKKGT